MSENEKRNYEARCLLRVLSSIVNQEPVPQLGGQPDWGEIYKLADYHRVANVVYYAVLGIEAKGLIPWRKKFEERFHQAVQNEERYSTMIPYVMGTLEKRKVHCIIPREYQMRKFYPHPDMRLIKDIVIMVETGKKKEIEEVMTRLDFEKKGSDETVDSYYKIPGVHVGFQETVSYTNKKMHKYFSVLPKSIAKIEGYRYLHERKAEEHYIYMIGYAAERYARGSLDIRDILDLWYYYKAIYESLDWNYISGEFEKIGILNFSVLIIKLAACWFGDMLFPNEDKLFLAMEKYILSKGVQGRSESGQLLPLVNEVADFYRKDMKKKRRQQMIAWVFPKMEYMDTMFPILHKHPWLLSICHILRLFRIVFRWFKNRCRAIKDRVIQKIKEQCKRVKQIVLRGAEQLKAKWGNIKFKK